MKRVVAIIFILSVALVAGLSQAQPVELAAKLEVRASGVDVIRVNTEERIPVNVETVIGVGDTIYTGETGIARVSFFNDIAVEIEPNTTYRIVEFNSEGEDFTLVTAIDLGNITNIIDRELNENSIYVVNTPGMELSARGTVYAVRVEPNRRSSTVVEDGEVEASNNTEVASVPAGFGVRASANTDDENGISDVVPVFSFAQLDSNLDGCDIAISAPGDVSLNVRLGPSLDYQQVGFIAPSAISLALGELSDNGWYRVEYAGSYGWVLANAATVDPECAGLRQYDMEYQEDPATYDPSTNMPLLVNVE